MAKIESPLLSDSASGSVGPCLTFSQKKSGQQVRFQKKQKDVASDPRLLQRAKFLDASLSCRFFGYGGAFYGIVFAGVDKAFYDEKAAGKPLTGYNVCIEDYLS